MVQKFKQLTLKCGSLEVQILGLKKYEIQCKKFNEMNQKQNAEIKFQ